MGSTRDLGLFPSKADGKFPAIRPLTNANMSDADTAMLNTYAIIEQEISLSSISENNMVNKDMFRYTLNPQVFLKLFVLIGYLEFFSSPIWVKRK